MISRKTNAVHTAFSLKVRWRQGQALVPVLLVMLILTILGVSFAVSAQRELRSGTNFAAETQRYYAARGAALYAASALASSSNNGATYGVVTSTGDTDANGWRPMGDAWVKVEVVDSGAGISLNGADLAMLQKLPVFRDNPEAAASIVDWRSPGDQPSQNGAKSEYYHALNPAYDCKNAPFDTVEELLLVKGMTPALLYGNASGSPISSRDLQAARASAASGQGSASGGGSTAAGGRIGAGSSGTASPGRTRQAGPAPGSPITGASGAGSGGGGTPAGSQGSPNGQNGAADSLSQDDSSQFQDLFTNSHLPLSELLVPTNRERNVSADGQPRVNINTATDTELAQKLGLSRNVVRNLIDYRNGGTGGVGGGGRPTNGNSGSGQNGTNGGRPRPGNGQNGNGQNGNGGRPRPNGGRPRPGGLGRQAAGGQPASGEGTNGGQNPPNSPNNSNSGTNSQAQNGTGDASGAKKGFRTIGDLLEVNGITRTVMQQIADKVTTDEAAIRENIFNINTAPAEVLATAPGMTRTMLDAILNYRQGGQAFQTLGDLFTIQSLQREDFEKAIGSLTTKSSLYTVRVKVKMPRQSGLYAAAALIELTETGPRLRQWREVPRLPGWSQWIPAPALPQPASASGGGSASSPN